MRAMRAVGVAWAMASISGCATFTHRIVLAYEPPPLVELTQDAQWQQLITKRVNDIAGCLNEQQRACLDQLDAPKGTP